HSVGAVRGAVGEAVVVVLPVPVAEVAEGVEEVAGEQAHADAQLQHEQVGAQQAVLLGGLQGGEEDLGGGVGEGAVVVDDEGDGVGGGQEGFVAALGGVLWVRPPLQALGQRHEVLDHFAASLSVSKDRLGGRVGGRRGRGTLARFRGAHGVPRVEAEVLCYAVSCPYSYRER